MLLDIKCLSKIISGKQGGGSKSGAGVSLQMLNFSLAHSYCLYKLKLFMESRIRKSWPCRLKINYFKLTLYFEQSLVFLTKSTFLNWDKEQNPFSTWKFHGPFATFRLPVSKMHAVRWPSPRSSLKRKRKSPSPSALSPWILMAWLKMILSPKPMSCGKPLSDLKLKSTILRKGKRDRTMM